MVRATSGEATVLDIMVIVEGSEKQVFCCLPLCFGVGTAIGIVNSNLSNGYCSIYFVSFSLYTYYRRKLKRLGQIYQFLHFTNLTKFEIEGEEGEAILVVVEH